MSYREDELEQDYFRQTRKDFKREKKIASATDRSYQKKTDRDQKQKQKELLDERKESSLDNGGKTILEGQVISIQSQGIIVNCEGKRWTCVLRGALKKEKWDSKNLITVGDFVKFEPVDDSEGSITDIKERYSVLSRADNLSRRKEQLIAANIDQVLITLSVVNPELRPAIADRYIIAARKGNMAPVIVVNKIDLLEQSPEHKPFFDEFVQACNANSLSVIPVSSETGAGMDQLKSIMQGKTSVFSGQSGVGKSSLINAMTGSDLRVGETVAKTKKGAHTTTTAQLLPLPFGGWTIDTPGIRSFGLWELDEHEISSYFADIYAVGQMCHYPNCKHIDEPDCAVRLALDDGKISPLRLASYYALRDSVIAEHRRR
ncbi:MAG: ribosome biosis GTPase RsgA [Chlamydiales bacterium]|jgi:ribosome biogenesis GTPase|nr:ribosome biosis GTPase RsgA [Chlamydiales bacterium]